MWNKALSFNLLTHCNVDKQVHAKLFIMQKLGVLQEYLITLIEKDIKDKKSPVLKDSFCASLVLNELGYCYDFNNENLSSFEEEAKILKKNLSKRNQLFEKIKKENPLDFESINKNNDLQQKDREINDKENVEVSEEEKSLQKNQEDLNEQIKKMNQELVENSSNKNFLQALV